jgi:hypothetical protein
MKSNYALALIRRAALLSLLWNLAAETEALAQGTAFVYQGRLNSNGAPATGLYDLRFKLFLDPLGNNQLGSALLTNGVPVTNGLFTLPLDFGGGVFSGTSYWLGISVKTNGGASYVDLTPLQPLTPVPYAIYAENAVNGGLAAGIYTNAVTLNNPSNNFSGTFIGNGASVSNVNALTLNGLAAGAFWQLGGNTVAAGQFIGSLNNQPVELWANQLRALRLEPDTNSFGAPNVIGGAPNNFVDPGIYGATIAGGGVLNYPTNGYEPGPGSNHVSAIWGTIGGGRRNTVGADHSVIAGGHDNLIQPFAYDSVVGGGSANTISNFAQESVIAGGEFNKAGGSASTVGGGDFNSASASYATVSGGYFNNATANYTTVGGGYNNTIQSLAAYSTIAGGEQNMIQAIAFNNNIGGYNSTIAGGLVNTIGSPYATIGGGSYHSIGTNSNSGFIGGGYYNRIANNTFDSTIAGGSYSSIGTNSFASTIAGGSGHSIGDNSTGSTIAGGNNNTASASYTSVGGGYRNSAGVISATVGGGFENTAMADSGTVGGGAYNSVFAPGAAVSGGGGNSASGYAAAVAGYSNVSSGYAATVPGGQGNQAGGQYSFAAGQQAYATNDSTFVWADSQNAPFASTGVNQFLVRALGGVGVNTNNPAGAALNVAGTVRATSYQGDGSGLINVSSGALGNYVFAYNGSLQIVAVGNVFQDVTFAADAQLSGWMHAAGTSQYTNAQTGLYLCQYFADVTTSSGNGTNAQFRATLNGVEIPGSRAAVTFSALSQFIAVSKSLMFSANTGDVLTFQFTGSGTGIRLFGTANSTLTVTRIQ